MSPRSNALLLFSLGVVLAAALLLFYGVVLRGNALEGDREAQAAPPPEGFAALETSRAAAEPHLRGRMGGGRRLSPPKRVPRVAPPPPPTHDVTAHVVGLVVNANGHPVPRATVKVEGFGWSRETTADAGGCYDLLIPWKGTHTLHAEANGWGTGTVSDIVVERDGELKSLPIVVRGAGRVSGVVLFPDGSPAGGVVVETGISTLRGGSRKSSEGPGLLRCLSVTDARGCFRASGLRLGPYVVSAPRVAEQDVYAWADHGQHDVRLVLRTRRVRVLVHDSSGQEPPELDVRVTRVRNGVLGWGLSLAERPDGLVEIWGRTGEQHVLCVRCKGCVTKERVIEFAPDVWSRDEELVLQADDGVRGLVGLSLRRENGTWIRGLSVRTYTESGFYHLPRFRDVPAGANDLIALPPGRWMLEVQPAAALEDDYEGYDFPSRGLVEVVARARRDLSLVSRLGGRVRVVPAQSKDSALKGVVYVAYGLQVPPELSDDDERDYEQLGDSRGDPVLGPIVKPGPWLLEISGDGVRSEVRRVVVEAGRTLNVNVDPQPASSEDD